MDACRRMYPKPSPSPACRAGIFLFCGFRGKHKPAMSIAGFLFIPFTQTGCYTERSSLQARCSYAGLYLLNSPDLVAADELVEVTHPPLGNNIFNLSGHHILIAGPLCLVKDTERPGQVVVALGVVEHAY